MYAYIKEKVWYFFVLLIFVSVYVLSCDKFSDFIEIKWCNILFQHVPCVVLILVFGQLRKKHQQ
ncbi:MAG: hypothetical protein EXX96DRAFT_577325 [Benjaminiella poitrasii]|nr:MAG: hypothetical protein EXX96DRAFT_577325 [Benjaminiella poitrasii]